MSEGAPRGRNSPDAGAPDSPDAGTPDSPDANSPDTAAAEAQARFEARMARALVSPDPAGAMQALAAAPDLPEVLRRAVVHALTRGPGAHGVALTALLVANLRFERLMQGSLEAAAWFARDPSGFTDAFRDYHHQVAPADYFPSGEAARFAAWLAHRTRA